MPFSFDPQHPLDAPSRLSLVRAKIERAKKNLADMERELTEFHRELAASRTDGNVIHVLPERFMKIEVTFDALCAAGDIVNNLRSALDHLIFQLIDVHSPNSPAKVFERCAFPICQNVTSYEAAKRTKLQGISPDATKLLDACKPYKGADNPLWLLDELNNICKHRLIITVAQEVWCHADWLGKVSFTEWFQYKFRDPHFKGIYGFEMDDQGKLATEKPVINPQIVGGNALLPTLHQLVDFVDALIDQFLPVLE